MEGEQDNRALTFVFAQHTHSPLFGARSHLFAAGIERPPCEEMSCAPLVSFNLGFRSSEVKI